MESNGDIYKEAIDYIREIEKQIEFSLGDSHLELDGESITSKDINTYCDILLDKINQELYITSNLEKDDLNANSNASTPPSNNNDFLVENKCAYHERKPPSPPQTGAAAVYASNNIDKITNYRYSFYDNSNKISIYVATSSLIDQALEEKRRKPSSSHNSNGKVEVEDSQVTSIFGCHPNLIQRSSHGSILPVFIENAFVYLSKFGLTSVGIFRKSGVKSRINALKKQIETGTPVELDSLCVYDVADLVKTWLRDLRPHLITKELIDAFAESKDDFSLWNLDDSHRYLVFVVLKFLSIVSSHSKQNQMTSQNLAICFAPSLCECDTEHHILKAQKFLEHCIENAESLFYITVNPASVKLATTSLNRHTSTAIISASPQDILGRLLYERSSIDPLILDWCIKDQTKHGDIFEVNFQFSSFLPNKTFIFKRSWTTSDNNSNIRLEEIADLFNSTWHLKSNGEGQTQVIHELELDFRGFSRRWYKTTFAMVHNQQLHQLTSSFESAQQSQPDSTLKLLISDV